MREKDLEELLNGEFIYLPKKHMNAFREELLEEQEYRCACCNKPLKEEANTNRHLDHCHKEKTVRSVLCATCNLVIGKIEKAGYGTEWLDKAIKYLNSTSTKVIYPEKITQRRKTKKKEMKKLISDNSWNP